jgi:ribosomal protein L37AE/L43A
MNDPETDDNEQPAECESCNFETSALKDYRKGIRRDESKWLCELCASTHAGSALEYTRQYEGQRVILQTICYVGNLILSRLPPSPSGERGA